MNRVFQESLEQWNVVFILSSVILVFTNLVYVIYASGDEQEWNSVRTGSKDSGQSTEVLTTESSMGGRF